MTPRDDPQVGSSQLTGARAASSTRIVPFVAGAAGIMLLLLANYARTWRSLTAVVAVCPTPFCDFVDYYYPMGQAVFRTGLPVSGFLYSPFVALLLAVFGPLGLDAALVLWGILQVLSVSVCVLLFRRLVPERLSIQLLFVALTVSSYPPVLNLIGGSVSVFMTASILGLLVANQRGHRAAAAGLLAFAVSFKFYPIIFLAPFAARRDTRFVLFAAAACGALLFAVPGVLLGPGDTLRFYGALLGSFRESDWVVTNVHSQYFPHVVLRLAGALGHDVSAYVPVLQWLAAAVAVANIGLLLLVQRARLRNADLWGFQLLILTIPFVLKTSWPHDFVFLSFAQALLAWWLLEAKGAAPGIDTMGNRLEAGASRERTAGTRTAVALFLLLSSIVISNIGFFGLFGSFSGYGFCAFPFWADLLLLTASYLVLLPAAVRQLRRNAVENGRGAVMTIRRQLLLLCALVTIACGTASPVAPHQLPSWLTSLIRQLEAQPVANPPAFIARYEYRGQVVYYVPARCCDIWSTLYDAGGTILCHPDGGLAGTGDGRCPTFMAERTNEQIIWRDPRGAT